MWCQSHDPVSSVVDGPIGRPYQAAGERDREWTGAAGAHAGCASEKDSSVGRQDVGTTETERQDREGGGHIGRVGRLATSARATCMITGFGAMSEMAEMGRVPRQVECAGGGQGACA